MRSKIIRFHWRSHWVLLGNLCTWYLKENHFEHHARQLAYQHPVLIIQSVCCFWWSLKPGHWMSREVAKTLLTTIYQAWHVWISFVVCTVNMPKNKTKHLFFENVIYTLLSCLIHTMDLRILKFSTEIFIHINMYETMSIWNYNVNRTLQYMDKKSLGLLAFCYFWGIIMLTNGLIWDFLWLHCNYFPVRVQSITEWVKQKYHQCTLRTTYLVLIPLRSS